MPRLIGRLGPNVASVILGALWALWHWPLFAIAGTAQYGTRFLPFGILLTAWSVVMTLVVIRAHGSVVAAMLFHASANLCSFAIWGPSGFMLGLGPWVLAGVIAAWSMRHEGRDSQRVFERDGSGLAQRVA